MLNISHAPEDNRASVGSEPNGCLTSASTWKGWFRSAVEARTTREFASHELIPQPWTISLAIICQRRVLASQPTQPPQDERFEVGAAWRPAPTVAGTRFSSPQAGPRQPGRQLQPSVVQSPFRLQSSSTWQQRTTTRIASASQSFCPSIALVRWNPPIEEHCWLHGWLCE